MKNILFVASEGVPFIKTGGLADVVGSLPKEIDKNYYDVRVFLPKYSCIRQEMKDRMEYITSFYMDFDWKSMYVGILKAEANGVIYYFIDNEELFNTYKPYTDDALFEIKRFSFFSKAVLSALPTIGFRPDLIHCHDWQTGLVPVYLKERFQENEFYRGIKTVMTIHNLRFQGKWNVRDVENITGLSGYYFTPDKLEAYKDANLLKGGIVYADAITTVSPTYAEEIKTQYYGEGLDGILNARAHDLRGILNGIDYDEFNPETDRRIPHPYNASNFRKEKIRNKIELQKELGLRQDEKCFMIGIVSRLTDQKGFDLIAYVMEEMLSLDAIQVVVLGT
ncbi:MAG TPA: starch synthase, partial [Lachnospiraceae bacterium]|nr:starch synthase [Lachnospiraceae bacterium]